MKKKQRWKKKKCANRKPGSININKQRELETNGGQIKANRVDRYWRYLLSKRSTPNVWESILSRLASICGRNSSCFGTSDTRRLTATVTLKAANKVERERERGRERERFHVFYQSASAEWNKKVGQFRITRDFHWHAVAMTTGCFSAQRHITSL